MNASGTFRSSDSDARDRIRFSLDESLIVEAAAGTGKTSALVGRIVRVVQTGRARMRGIVAVTFTRKAAGELRLRLRHELDRRRNDSEDPAERARMDDAIVHLEEAHVGTIHGFASDILRERPVEAGIQPGFEELDENESVRLFDRVFQHWFEMRMEDPPPGIRRALARAHSDGTGSSPREQIRNAAWNIVEWRDHPRPWTRKPFDRSTSADRLVGSVGELARLAAGGRPRDPLRVALSAVIDVSMRIERSEAVHPRDYDEAEGLLVRLARDLSRDKRKGRGRFSPNTDREAVLRQRGALVDDLLAFRTEADADLAAALREELWELRDLYDVAKRDLGKVDFVDLLLATRNLLRDNPVVRSDLQARFSHIFVDEFQDTDPLQAEILSLIAADDAGETDWARCRPVPGKLFLVGDPKQSIYRFRRADVILYQDLAERLEGQNVERAFLSRSFRSGPTIQRLVNAAFAPTMDGDRATGQPRYVPLEPHRTPVPDQPSVVALPIGRPYGRNAITKSAINRELPHTVGAFVEWLVERSGWKVHDSTGTLVGIAPRHIAILFRRFVSWGRDITRDYVHALEVRDVPHVLLGARSYHQREEVETLRAALEAIEWPDDELSVYATLKGALFAIPDSLLLRYAKEVGRIHPFRSGNDSDESLAPDFAPIREALDTIARLHRRRNRQSFAETISALLSATRAHAGFALRPAGNQVLANLYQVTELARSYESREGASFRGFVERLREEALSTGNTEAPALEEGAEGVRLMTVHSAKGLEFPIVILADITANLAAASPSRYVEGDIAAMRLAGCTPWDLEDHVEHEHRRDLAEGVRIAYVAATRASDLLVVPAVGDRPGSGPGPTDGWVAPLIRCLYPRRGRERQPLPAPGAPSFRGKTVLDRPPDRQFEAESSVAPGRHFTDEGVEVVWWDPALLTLDVPANLGLREEGILSDRIDPDAAGRSRASYAAWTDHRTDLIEAGGRPALRVMVASEADEIKEPEFGAGMTEVSILRRDETGPRPEGARFGTLVHLLLADLFVPLPDSDPREAWPSAEQLSAFHTRSLGGTPEEQRAAVEAAERVLAHSLIVRALAADRCYREYPLVICTAQEEVLEGIVDLAFFESGRWHVIDFKTDLPPGSAPLSPDAARRVGPYVEQVGRYRFMLERIEGFPTEGYLFGV